VIVQDVAAALMMMSGTWMSDDGGGNDDDDDDDDVDDDAAADDIAADGVASAAASTSAPLPLPNCSIVPTYTSARRWKSLQQVKQHCAPPLESKACAPWGCVYMCRVLQKYSGGM